MKPQGWAAAVGKKYITLGGHVVKITTYRVTPEAEDLFGQVHPEGTVVSYNPKTGNVLAVQSEETTQIPEFQVPAGPGHPLNLTAALREVERY